MMSADRTAAAPEKHLHLLDQLQELLNKQIAIAQKGDFNFSAELAEKSSKIVDELAHTGVWRDPGIRDRRERLVKSYRTIMLAITAEKDRIEKQILRVAQGRKTLRAYGSRSKYRQ